MHMQRNIFWYDHFPLTKWVPPLVMYRLTYLHPFIIRAKTMGLYRHHFELLGRNTGQKDVYLLESVANTRHFEHFGKIHLL